MTDELYLVLHKVRGEPAFDIATRCDDMGCPSDPGPWWIIPTSGHRAYPYQSFELSKLWYERNFIPTNVEPPEGWPDHYPDRPSPLAPRLVGSLLKALGLGRSAPIRRRPL